MNKSTNDRNLLTRNGAENLRRTCRASSGRMRRTAAVALTALAAIASQLHAQTFSGLGLYVGNPNGNDANAEAYFESQVNAFTSALGQNATTMDVFIDYTQPISTWASNASWSSWSMANSAPVKNLVPIVSVGLADQPTGSPGGNYSHDGSLNQMNAVAAGAYDTYFTGVVTAYRDQGFPKIYLRIGWEMDGGWEPWYATVDQGTVNAFVAAFQHVATLAKQVTGITVKTVWCPANINWVQWGVEATYPGDQYVDIIGPDAYSPIYADTTLNWENGTFAPDATTWSANTVNREHFWDYPNFTQWSYQSSGGYGLVEGLNFAKAHKKPFALSECGAGGNGGSSGPVDEGDFPLYLAARLSLAMSQGVAIEYVTVWDVNVGDGSWNFTDGTRPAELSAWKQFLKTMGLAQQGFTASKYEAESLAVANSQSAGGTSAVTGDSTLSNAQAVTLNSSSAGDYITFVVPKVAAGTYEVRVGLRKTGSSGKFQMQAGRADSFSSTAVNVGSIQDCYAPNWVYPEIDLGSWTAASAGDRWFRFNVTGQNSSSTGSSYNSSITIDNITLVPLAGAAVAALPAGWTDQDINYPAAAGSASYDLSSGNWTVAGSGADIWYGADQFNYASTAVTGDQTIIAKITGMQNTDNWAKAGVMFRDSASPGSMFVMVAATPANGIAMQWRTATSGQCGGAGAGGIPIPSASHPVWVKLARSGTSYTGCYSTDGTHWIQVSSIAASFSNATALAGLEVLSHSNGVLNTATFNSVSIAPTGPAAGAWYRLTPRHATGSSLDVDAGSQANGAKVQIWTWYASTNQEWGFQPTDSGYYRIVPRSGPTKCLDISGGPNATANGTQVWQWDWVNGTNQQWKLEPTDSGYYRLTPRNATGECLDIAGVSTANGAMATIWQFVGGLNQQWRLDIQP